MASMNVIVVLPLAMLLWARLVKSHSIHPKGLFNVSVERVISLVEQDGAVAQTTLDSVKPLHG